MEQLIETQVWTFHNVGYMPSRPFSHVNKDTVSPRLVFCGFCNGLVFTDSSTPLFSISDLCCLVIRFVLVHA